jgi:hypothetical protein
MIMCHNVVCTLILYTVKLAVLESKWNHTIPFHKGLHLM